MLGKVPAIKWKSVFKKDYAQAERQAVMCRAKADTDVSAWVNATDVFDDLLLNALYRHDTSLGKYTLGKIGSVLNGGRLQKAYPAIYALVEDMHARRLESALSHPTVRKTGHPTKLIKYGYLKKAKSLIRAALAELAAKW